MHSEFEIKCGGFLISALLYALCLRNLGPWPKSNIAYDKVWNRNSWPFLPLATITRMVATCRRMSDRYFPGRWCNDQETSTLNDPLPWNKWTEDSQASQAGEKLHARCCSCWAKWRSHVHMGKLLVLTDWNSRKVTRTKRSISS